MDDRHGPFYVLKIGIIGGLIATAVALFMSTKEWGLFQ